MAKKKASKETTKAKPKSKPVDTEPVDVAAVEAPPELSGSDIQRNQSSALECLRHVSRRDRSVALQGILVDDVVRKIRLGFA